MGRGAGGLGESPWLLAIRPKTLPAALAPVIVAGAYAIARGEARPLPLIVALLCALLIQIASNLANDLFDFRKGADTEARTGPVRVVQAGLISQRGVLGGLALVIGLAAVFGLYLVWVGGVPILVIGVLSLICAVLYTGGPFPIGYLGLGELFVFVFFGPVATFGTVLVATGRLDPVGALLGVPLGLLCANILVVNNVRDVETDAVARKQTLAVRFGRGFGVGMYRASLIGAGIATFAVAFAVRSPWPLLSLVALPAGRALLGALVRERGPVLNPILGRTAQLELRYAIGLALSLLLMPLFHKFL